MGAETEQPRLYSIDQSFSDTMQLQERQERRKPKMKVPALIAEVCQKSQNLL